MENIAGIIAQFAEYLSALIGYVMEIFNSLKKDDKAE